MPAKTNQSSFIDTAVSPLGIAVIIVILLLLSAGTYFYAKRGIQPKKFAQESISAVQPTPTPIVLLPDDGVKGTYAVSQGKHEGPTIAQIVFNPLNATKDQPLSITVKITDTVPVQTVTGILEMDNGTQNLPFTRFSGTDTDGVWQTTTTLSDSVLYTYIMRTTAISKNGTNTVSTAPRSK